MDDFARVAADIAAADVVTDVVLVDIVAGAGTVAGAAMVVDVVSLLDSIVLQTVSR